MMLAAELISSRDRKLQHPFPVDPQAFMKHGFFIYYDLSVFLKSLVSDKVDGLVF